MGAGVPSCQEAWIPQRCQWGICTKCLMFDRDELWLTGALLQAGALQPFPAGCQGGKCPFRQQEVLFCACSFPSWPSQLSSFFQLAEKYGPIFTLHFGFQKVVVLTGYEVVREALVNYTEEFVDRPSIPIFDQIQNGNGTRARSGGWEGRRWLVVPVVVVMMMMRHSLTVHSWSPAFKHPLGPFWRQVTANIWLSLHTMSAGFPSFLLMQLQPIHIQKAEGWEEWDFEGTVVIVGLISVRCRCHHHVYEPSAHFQETLDYLAWLLGAVGFFPFSHCLCCVSSHTFASPQKFSGWPAWIRLRQKREAEAGNSPPPTIPQFFQDNFPPLTVSEDFLSCPSSASCEALAGRTKRQLYMPVTGWNLD